MTERGVQGVLLAWAWPVSFERPEWLWLLATIPLIVLISRRSLAGLERWRRVVAIVLRSSVIVALSLALARVQYVRQHDRVAVMFVLDKSRSIPEDLRRAAQEYIKQVAAQASGEDRVGVISFDGRADVDLVPSKGGVTTFGFGMASEPGRTDISSGLRLALAAFPEGFGRRVVLLTDGNENSGDLSEELEMAVANGVAVDVVPLRYQHVNEMLVDRIVVPAQVSRDTRVPVRLVLKSRQPGRARITLEHNGEPAPLANDVVELEGGMKPVVVRVPVEMFGGGVHRLDVRLTPIPAEADAITENNRATAFTFVEDRGRVLIVTQAGSTDDVVLRDALLREKVDVEMRGVDQVGVDLLELQKYGVLVLANIAADAFTEAQHKALASYVRDFGGGLIMTGGNESFGAGGWIGSPVEQISPVSFSLPHRQHLPSAALVLVLDRSGSMASPVGRSNCTQQMIANESAVLALRTLLPQDQIGVVAFSGAPEWIVELQYNSNPERVARIIRAISPGGGTCIYPALEYAYQALASIGSGPAIKHVILLTDGQSAEGPYATLVQDMISAGITLSTIGVGDGVNDELLSMLAERGGGRYYPVRNARLLPQVFFRETRTLRRRLISEEPFTPQLVASFSQIMAGLGGSGLPPLRGLVLTHPKPDIIMPLVRKKDDGEIEPVFAHWQYEMGKMAVFTSGWWPRWGADWASWEQFGKFWAQTVRWAMRQEGSANFDIVTRLEGNTGKIAIEALNKDTSYLNFLQIAGLVTPPSMESQPLRLTQTGPGQYEATFDVHDDGNYLVNLRYTDPEGKVGLIRTGLSVPYSPEFRQLETNLALLEKAVQRGGGRMLAMDPQTDDVFSRDLPPSVSRQPFWRWVVTWLLLPLFLLDVAGRRLASTVAMSVYVELAVFAVLFGVLYTARASMWGCVGAMFLAECVGWLIRRRYIEPTIRFFTATVAALSRAGQRSAASLAQLKDVRERVRDDLEGSEPPRPQTRTEPLESLADRRARFDVGDEAAAKPAGDLSKELGGAETVIEAQKLKAQTRTVRGVGPGAPGDLASRLREAKRRAREQIEERNDDKGGPSSPA